MNRQLYNLHAEICKTLSNPKRLEMLNILRGKQMSVGDIAKKMSISKANVSQHLSLMKKAGILVSRRHGVNIYYRISNPKVIKACDLMREVLVEHHSQRDKILKSLT
ncbi:MAG: metalloregulator ArsR/SmtB family transcription factor [Candidatus Eisenbacteria bacterium]|nr:metalloregulator ArsR/SmtB family transcription factor [Candidatus Eisenbacteria bacterium]